MAIQTGIADRLRMATQTILNRAAKRLLAGRYTLAVPQFYTVYSPWFEPEFLGMLAGPIRDNTLLSEDRLYILHSFVQQCAALPGDMAECGVYRGGSAYLIAELLAERGSTRPVYFFDSFEGMPSTVRAERDSHRSGDFGDTTLKHVQALLSQFSFAEIRPGFMPQTFAGLEGREFALGAAPFRLSLHAA
jgi:hypothetical protein